MLKARCWNMQEQYLEFSTVIPASSALYGLGERSSSTGIELRRDGIPLALWNHDSPAAAPDQNVYGSHPILMEVREGAEPVLGAFCLCCCLRFLPLYLHRLAMVRVHSCLERASQFRGCWLSENFSGIALAPTWQNPFPVVHCRCLSRAHPAFDCEFPGGGVAQTARRTARCCRTGTARTRLAHGSVLLSSNGMDGHAHDLTPKV